jgi:23S rRNA (adenine2503-C2)-methyltransferase
MNRINILECTYSDFLDHFTKATSAKGPNLARALYRQVMVDGVFAPEDLIEFRQTPRILEKTLNTFELRFPNPKDSVLLNELSVPKKNTILEGTEKIVLCTDDHWNIESVVIPMQQYKTLCVSSQVGCAMACTFCETAKMGLIRSLNVAEIVGQLYYAKHVKKEPIRNIVFMGMGEPLDNLDAVLKSLEIFTDDAGFNLSKKHITISTSGRVDGIEKLAALGAQKFRLAVSLNATRDELRNRLMPLNRKYNLASLKAALLHYPLPRDGVVFLEYVMIRDVNDFLRDAQGIVEFCEGLKIRVNLIPYNPGSKSGMQPTTSECFDHFAAYLRQAGIHVTTRVTKGDAIMAACGQLGDMSLRGRRSPDDENRH